MLSKGKLVVGPQPKTTLQRLLAGAGSRPLIGSNLISGGPEWMELCGNAGFDFVCVDQMVSAMGWQETNEMLRAAAAGKTSGWVRLSAYPWGGNDQRAFLQRDVLKAIAIGAEAILASVDNARDAAALVEMPAAHVRHRKYAVRGRDTDGIVPEGLPSIIPLVESDNALANLTQFTSIAALEAVFMGVGDLARLKGVAADVRDPTMAGVLRDAVQVCAQTGVTVMCSTGRSDTLDEILTSVDLLWGIGVKVIWVPNPSHIAFKLYRTVMDRIR
jgi:2-keto-3-deoxy-L-rhamnonate aldolase RhmA